MTDINTDEIETIVRRVMRELASQSSAASGGSSAMSLVSGADSVTRLRIEESVVSWENVKDRLEGIRTIEVGERAVITPLLRDELRSRTIQVARRGSVNELNNESLHTPDKGTSRSTRGESSSELNRISLKTAVIGESRFSDAIRRFAQDEIHAFPCDESSEKVFKQTTELLARGVVRILVVSRSPFLIASELGRNQSVKAIMLARLKDLSTAVQQAEPNVMVVDRSEWSAASLARLIHNWKRLTQT